MFTFALSRFRTFAFYNFPAKNDMTQNRNSECDLKKTERQQVESTNETDIGEWTNKKKTQKKGTATD